ncbi:hypothetical protein PORY_002217 [Pneumocystis oryctolagi]|uniref:Uncharacterized protein n=1 Tax=Pneumocystis oryctolagi TaxID=42067 RepID=A0ACB7CBR5_9ASCO|nr:hypothetical protein PORY_002217 [Pneumocystis oryctolagi]
MFYHRTLYFNFENLSLRRTIRSNSLSTFFRYKPMCSYIHTYLYLDMNIPFLNKKYASSSIYHLIPFLQSTLLNKTHFFWKNGSLKHVYLWGTKFTWFLACGIFVYINYNNFAIQCQSCVEQDLILQEDKLNIDENTSIFMSMENLIKTKQREIIQALEAIDGQKFKEDLWEKDGIVGKTYLTPSYLFDEDAIHFHSIYKNVCDNYDKEYYSKFKKWCDQYFYIKHREESRGIGGIFFDDLNDKNSKELFSFVKDCLNAFLPSYIPILLRRKDMDYTFKEKQFQQIRCGRYAEFNLVYDRGTAFGLNVPGSRIESILMTLPLTASWEYQYIPEDPREKRLIEVLKNPKEWA